MSDSDSTMSTTAAPELDHPTQEIAVTRPDRRPAPGPGGTGEPPWDAGVTDDDDEWPDRGPRQGIRMSVPTVALFGLLIAAGGIWGGAALQRSQGTSSGSSAAASSFASLFRNRGGTTGGGGFAAALAGATSGTVTEVQGSTLYVTNSSGALVKVTVGPSATVDRNAASSLGSLQVGDTVIVQGTKASNGSVTASSVSATAAGVTSGFSRLGAGATPAGG
jgi:Domain of unknown function (DUF5666)